MDRPDHGGAERLLFAAHELFEVVYCNAVERWEIHADIGRKKVVYLPLAVVLGRKLFRADGRLLLWLPIRYLLHVLILVLHSTILLKLI